MVTSILLGEDCDAGLPYFQFVVCSDEFPDDFVRFGHKCAGRTGARICVYVSALQSANQAQLKQITTSEQFESLLSETGGLAQYPILKGLGTIVNTAVVSSAAFSNFTSYKVDITHASGGSSWQFRLDASGARVAGAVLLQTKESRSSRAFTSTKASTAWSKSVLANDIGGLVVSDLTTAISPTVSMSPCSVSTDACNRSTGPKDSQTVEFLFATDRLPGPSTDRVSFIGDRQPKLSFGAATVRIPDDHRIGQISLPSVWRLFGFEIYREKENDKKHFSIKRLSILTQDDWGMLIKEQGTKSALIFVHGFNTGFEDAIYRNAQIIYDLQYQGLSVLFSWSSKGGDVTDYGYDGNSAMSARDRFIQLMSLLQNDYGIERINVLAHSMGNQVVVDSLVNNSRMPNPLHLEQLIMAAPDVDRRVFSQAIPEIKKITKGMTLYASSADRALKTSAALAKSPRAGDVPADIGPVVLQDLDTIDVTNIGDELLGLNHSEFATNRDVINDIRSLFLEGKRPPRLAEIRPMPAPPKPTAYWRYVK